MLTQQQQNVLADWFKLQQQLKELKQRESDLRDYLFEEAFPDLDADSLVGTHRSELPQGYTLVARVTQGITVDQSAVEACLEKLTEKQLDGIGEWVFKLDKKGYNGLTKSAQKKFASCLVMKPGKPTLEIAPPAEEPQ